jgi:hypothetical protein
MTDAQVSPPRVLSTPGRLVIVPDPASAAGEVWVWWRLDRRQGWRCGSHGKMRGLRCRHVRTAARVLALELFGVEDAAEEGD